MIALYKKKKEKDAESGQEENIHVFMISLLLLLLQLDTYAQEYMQIQLCLHYRPRTICYLHMDIFCLLLLISFHYIILQLSVSAKAEISSSFFLRFYFCCNNNTIMLQYIFSTAISSLQNAYQKEIPISLFSSLSTLFQTYFFVAWLWLHWFSLFLWF